METEIVLNILKLILAGWPLSEVLTIIAERVESRGYGTLCTIWLSDEDGKQLRCAAAHSLPGFSDHFIERAVILSPYTVLRAPTSELEPFSAPRGSNVPITGPGRTRTGSHPPGPRGEQLGRGWPQWRRGAPGNETDDASL